MKIVDIICSAGRTGFYFDDQRAIKGGAGLNGTLVIEVEAGTACGADNVYDFHDTSILS